ncbi:MAG: 30S ribosomal protein S17 [bacterium]|nr:30S ribosomal protein S17 [bacterium]
MKKLKISGDTESRNGKIFLGRVVSTAMQKTVVVEVSHSVRHPIYKKSIRRVRKFSVHNESFDLVKGDFVEIQEVKPISKRKHFTVIAKGRGARV